MLSQIVANTSDDVQRRGSASDPLSFNRGAALGIHLIGGSLGRGIPPLSVASEEIVSEGMRRFPALDGLRAAADGLLASQPALNGAFDFALPGMPDGTSRDMARFGAGIVALGVMAAVQVGGNGVEVAPI
ncbi:MAG TPA: hypothetical protein VLF71_05515 [Candidatus Saccharimonadales bacterium]|nr:hypothetical protein [Candidatus Saccharimonadales bacterium]